MDPQLRFFFFMMLFLWIMSSNPNQEERYPSFINKDEILEEFKANLNISHRALLSDYSNGYGNITGFHLSYKDALDNRNISKWPDHKDFFIEDQKYSILPNSISLRAANIWNSEGHVVDLPKNRDDIADARDGKKINSGAFPLNITGSLKGEFKNSQTDKMSLVPINLPLPHYLKKLYDYRLSERLRRDRENNRDPDDDFDDNAKENANLKTSDFPQDGEVRRIGNFTKPEGTIKVSLFNDPPVQLDDTPIDINGTTPITLDLRLNDKAQSDEHIMSLFGVYHQDTGNIVVASRSAKFSGVFGLPKLNLQSGTYHDRTQWALRNEMNKTKYNEVPFAGIESLVDASDECEYVGYFHIESTSLTREELQQIDYELSNPIGRPHREVPHLKITGGMLYSPNCAVSLEVGALDGVRDEMYDNSLRVTILLASIIMLSQIFVLIRQMSLTNTPSTLSKLSFWTISMMNMADGSLSIVCLLCSMVFNNLYIQFAVCAFLALTCSAIYEMKYAVKIYATQVNERQIDWRTMLQGTPIDVANERRDQVNASNASNGATGAATTPPTVAATEARGTGTADESAISAELFTRHFFSMLVFLFFVLNVITWPKKSRQFFEYFFITVFNSYWVPQIYRNTLRGSRASFSWEFIISTSILRLLPAMYIEVFKNPFNHHKDIGFAIFLVIWLSIQISILFAQEALGPRFFLNDKYLPQAYDYHPVITKGDIESGFNFDTEELVSDGSSSSNEDSRSLKYVTDCAICMQKLEVPIVNTQSNLTHTDTSATTSLLPTPTSAAGIIARRKYMVTPCNHIFHTDCLENWMMYKLQCPVCRNNLPPF
jgi:hypothetical protein